MTTVLEGDPEEELDHLAELAGHEDQVEVAEVARSDAEVDEFAVQLD